MYPGDELLQIAYPWVTQGAKIFPGNRTLKLLVEQRRMTVLRGPYLVPMAVWS